ncbi:hypothetical protein BVY02_00870, partial [bacterium J17]
DANFNLEALKASANGSIAPTLREIANVLKEFANGNSTSQTSGQTGAQTNPQTTTNSPIPEAFSNLRADLSLLLTETFHNNSAATKSLDQLINNLTEDVKSKAGKSSEKSTLQKTLSDLIQIRDQPEGAEEKLKALISNLPEPAHNNANKSPIDGKSKSELLQLASRLEQMANTQEMLSRMNPVMQALGEPALLLFPFIFQGLLSHSEVSLESYIDPKNPNVDEDEEGAGGSKSGKYHRIQLSVPLPNLGEVEIDIAHRKEEIFVRMILGNPEAGEFLISKMDQLGAILQELGYSTRELMTKISETKSPNPNARNSSNPASVVIA